MKRGDPTPYMPLIQKAASKHGVPAELLFGQIKQESGFDPDVISGKRKSSAGAVGISQFMPETAKRFGISPTDPAQAIDAQARYLKLLRDQFGTWDAAFKAYNWGEGNYGAYLRTGRGLKGQPMPAETQNYAPLIFGHAKQYAGGNPSVDTAIGAIDPGRDLLGALRSGTPAVEMPTPKGSHIALPSTQEEHDVMRDISQKGYSADVERQLTGALSQLLPARDQLTGKDLLGDSLPKELDGILSEIVDKV
jgi:hypothetical protein